MDNQNAQAQMQPVQFNSAFNLFKPSIHVLGANLGTYIALFASYIAPILIFVIILGVITGASGGSGSSAIFSIVLILFSLFYCLYVVPLFAASLILVNLKGSKEEQVTVKNAVKSAMPFVWRYLGLSLILAVIFVVSFILFIIPFFFMLKRYLLTPYIMIDQNLGIFDSMKKSAELSKKYSSAIWGIVGVTFLFACFWIIGYVLNLLYACAPVVRYRQIMAVEEMGGQPFNTPPTNPMPMQTPSPEVQNNNQQQQPEHHHINHQKIQ